VYIRKGDRVQVISGQDKGKQGEVLRVLRDEDRIVVQGCNKAHKHVKPNQRNPKGGVLSIEMPIHVSNVLLVNPDLDRGVRIGIKINAAGEKVRVCKKTGKELGVLRRAKSPAAKGGAK
jgi:large subunit ribosomal protein L24